MKCANISQAEYHSTHSFGINLYQKQSIFWWAGHRAVPQGHGIRKKTCLGEEGKSAFRTAPGWGKLPELGPWVIPWREAQTPSEQGRWSRVAHFSFCSYFEPQRAEPCPPPWEGTWCCPWLCSQPHRRDTILQGCWETMPDTPPKTLRGWEAWG